MDFAFSDEQQMLRDQARQFLADRYGLDEVMRLATTDEGWDPRSFREIGELGWTGLSIPETNGGAGMGFIDEAVIFEELGRALFPGPYFSTIGLALPALASDENLLAAVADGSRTATLAWAEPSGATTLGELDAMSTKAESSNGAWSITGEKQLVPDAGAVDTFVVVAASGGGVAMFAVERDDVEVEATSTVDRTRRFGTIRLSGANAQQLVDPTDSPSMLERVRQRALAALALEAVGVGQRALEMSIEHVKERKQFDKPIGSYQAVSHQIADAYVAVELARSLAYWAAWCVDESDEQAPVAVAAAKTAAADAAVTACERAIQVHGGIGFTWEHPLHLFYKRAQWIDAFDGHGPTHRERLAAALLA